jgi:hypothetical protein
MKSIMKEYIDFIDKILVDKKLLKQQLEEAHSRVVYFYWLQIDYLENQLR